MACVAVPWLSILETARAAGIKSFDSGCAPDAAGVIPCDPEVMRARASAQAGRAIPLDVYSLARNVASETGSRGTFGEKVAIAEAALNRARRDGVSISRLTMRDGARYARQRGTNPAVATSRDPTWLDLVVASLALAGRTGDFAKGATHYFAPSAYSATEVRALYDRWTSGWGSETTGLVWVGPLADVRPRKQLLFRPISKRDPLWRAMYEPGLVAALTGEDAPARLCQRDAGGRAAMALGLSALGLAAWYYLRGRRR